MKYKNLILPALLACMALTSCGFGQTSGSGTVSIPSSTQTNSPESNSPESGSSQTSSTPASTTPPITTAPDSDSTSVSLPKESDKWYFTTSSISWQIKEENLLTYTNYTDANSYECHFNVSITSGDVFKIVNESSNTLGYADLSGNTDMSKYSNDLGSEGGIKVNSADEYDIYVSVSNSSTSLEVIASSSFPTVDVNFSSINDFHGAINRNTSSYIPGLAYLATYLKQRKAAGDILINSGDMWQGTFESNFNSGALVTEAFKNIGFDAMVLGNHEFDWGPEAILANQDLSGTTYLGANIYNYDASKNPAYSTKADLGGNYIIKTLNKGTVNEVKVGIIGVIGKDQLSSIQANFVEDYIFIDPTETVKTLSQELKTEKDCDIVVASYHADQDDVNKEIVGGESGTGTKYVDAVFCAHTHDNEISYVNNVPFIQSGDDGNYVGKLSLTLTKSTGAVNYVSDPAPSNVNLMYTSLTADPEVQSIIDRYNAESSSTGAEVIGTISSQFKSNGNLANAIAKGMYDAAYKQGVTDIDYAITNYARNSISAGTVTYADVYTAVPFDNAIVIFEATGKDIYNEIANSRFTNYFYRANNEALVNSESITYKVAVCSYMAYHIKVDDNTYLKTLNYFPSMKNNYELEDNNGKVITYRQSLLDLLRGISGTINPSNFEGPAYSKSGLTSAL